jgi:adenine-specific DNA-methyltransferase
MTDKKIDSLKHKTPKRARIPSKEEAGYEAETPEARKTVAEFPLNPVTTRGQDPELYWMHKYGEDDRQTDLEVDIRSLYRVEHVGPEKLIQRLYRLKREAVHQDDMFMDELFGNYKDVDELDKPAFYYKQSDNWSNRLIQGDSLMVMTSLLEREGMAGQVQTIYIDPPYGIKYNSNWQIRVNDRNVKDGDDASLSGEPEVIKAFRDTWELGIHSYLTYLRDRLLVAKDLLTESGSCFVQISDENVHLVRCLMDEVFGSENFVSLITFKKTASQTSRNLASTSDYLIWYGKNVETLKYRQLYSEYQLSDEGADAYAYVELVDGSIRPIRVEERFAPSLLPDGAKPFQLVVLHSERGGRPSGPGSAMHFPVEFDGNTYVPPGTRGWTTTKAGIDKLIAKNRVAAQGSSIRYKRYLSDFPAIPIASLWQDTQSGSGMDKVFVVQTNAKIIQRCMLMTTDPGDLVLDPTCGSGTTAHVAEQWGRRWITTDTSRVALNIAKTRLMTASYPWYVLKDELDLPSPPGGGAGGEGAGSVGASAAERVSRSAGPSPQPSPGGRGSMFWDLRHGFDYKTVQRITLGSLANDEPPEDVTLYDQPSVDRKKLRVAGPFTVETLQSYEPLAPDAVEEASLDHERMEQFQARVFEHLKSAGVKNGAKSQMAVFARVDPLPDTALHAEGYYDTAEGEQKAYIHLGPQFAPVSRQAVNEAVKACRKRGDANWLLILGFAFESDVENSTQNQRAGSFEVTKVRMHDDLLQAGLTKKDKKAATFVTIGEPDIGVTREGDAAIVEIRGLDIYDPIRDEVKARSVADINYWMVDDDYDGSSFMVRQVFFCGGDKDEFAKWKKGLSDLAKAKTKKKLENALKIEIEDAAFDRLYGFVSHPIPFKAGKRIAVRVVSQFGEESTKVLTFA